MRHGAPLGVEIVGDGTAKIGIGQEMGRPGRHRHIAARQLVATLRAGFDPREAARAFLMAAAGRA